MTLELQKNVKAFYYITQVARYVTPHWITEGKASSLIEQYMRQHSTEREDIYQRVNYYNRLIEQTTLPDDATMLKHFKRPTGKHALSAYFFDTYEHLRYFPQACRFMTVYGDVTEVPQYPSIVKSRPISGENSNSVVLNLDKCRHFNFINDHLPFHAKRDMLVGRFNWVDHSPMRKRFFELYFGDKQCNLGTLEHINPQWATAKMTIKQQLRYKFVLSIEGNDVATNLKWVMSSNSLPVMPDPVYETWFMEGTLKPDYHYVRIRKDFSDLHERMAYYIAHPQAAEAIIRHNHDYVKQFWNSQREQVIALLVLQKYFEMTGQVKLL